MYEHWHAGRVRHSVATRLGGYDRPDLEDVVQETFVYAFEVIRRGGFDETRSDGGFRNWVAKIAISKLRDGVLKRKAKIRGAGREQLMLDLLTSSSAELIVPSPLCRPSEEMRAKELEEAIEVAFVRWSELADTGS